MCTCSEEIKCPEHKAASKEIWNYLIEMSIRRILKEGERTTTKIWVDFLEGQKYSDA